ncbi:hypothetical protein CQW23_05640 [Capsicum baccatum]|uniref:Uncharacterized protein n=1 Tax=Capsicum baccatum TaxID=33114 RepID=A0A2G2XI23_CAPBA|nr:hypothetical protein CQW23_05640 [Capsicum baccatum]
MGILSKLPVKSLVRFKCVSKFWNTLISHSYLKKQHLIHAKNQLSSQKLLFIKWDPNCHFWSSSLSLVQLVKDTRIFDCPSNSYPENGITVLWNPSTRESVLLPKSSLSSTHDDDIDVGSTYGLAYDSTSDDYKVLEIDINVEEDYAGCTYGLAFDPISDDYKVFRINMFRTDDNEIFALKNNASWRIIDHKISGRTDSSMLTGGEYLPFVHGAFHWLGMLSRFRVVSFNISDEMYGEISLPEIVCCLTLSKSEVEVDVGVSLLGEMLSVYYKHESFFILWVMNDYAVKDSWMNLFTIPISTGVYRIIPTYMFSDDVVLLCFDHHYGVKPDYLYRVIFSGAFGLSDRMWPLDGAVTIDEDDCVYTESLMSPRLGH